MLVFAGLCIAFALYGAWVRAQTDDRRTRWFRARKQALTDFRHEMNAWRDEHGHHAPTPQDTTELGEIAARLERRKLEADARWVDSARV